MQLQCSDGRASAYIKTTERWTKGVWPVLYHCTVAASRFRRASQQQPKGRPNELLYTYTLSFCFEMMIETHVNLFRIENTTCIKFRPVASGGWGGRGWGAVLLQSLTKKLTLSQPEGKIMPNTVQCALMDFQTLRRP